MEDRITVNYKGQDRELFMSYLRLNSCLRVIGNDPRSIAIFMIEPDMVENILRAVLAEKGGAGQMFDVALEDGDLSVGDVDAILLWVQEHFTDFFVKRFQQAQKSAADLEPMIAALASQGTGSAVSSGATPPAGPSV